MNSFFFALLAFLYSFSTMQEHNNFINEEHIISRTLFPWSNMRINDKYMSRSKKFITTGSLSGIDTETTAVIP